MSSTLYILPVLICFSLWVVFLGFSTQTILTGHILLLSSISVSLDTLLKFESYLSFRTCVVFQITWRSRVSLASPCSTSSLQLETTCLSSYKACSYSTHVLELQLHRYSAALIKQTQVSKVFNILKYQGERSMVCVSVSFPEAIDSVWLIGSLVMQTSHKSLHLLEVCVFSRHWQISDGLF